MVNKIKLKFPKIHKKIIQRQLQMPKEIPKEWYMSPKKDRELFDNLRPIIIA